DFRGCQAACRQKGCGCWDLADLLALGTQVPYGVAASDTARRVLSDARMRNLQGVDGGKPRPHLARLCGGTKPDQHHPARHDATPASPRTRRLRLIASSSVCSQKSVTRGSAPPCPREAKNPGMVATFHWMTTTA